VDRTRPSRAKQEEPWTAFTGRPPWSLLKTQWLDVPIGKNADQVNLTWGDFSQRFDACLRGVSLHFARWVEDRARLESLVTEVLIDNLGILVSDLGESDLLRSLCEAADRLLERGGFTRPGRD